MSPVRVVRRIITKTNQGLFIPQINFFKFNTLENKGLLSKI